MCWGCTHSKWSLRSEKKLPYQPDEELYPHLQMSKWNLGEPSGCTPLQPVSPMFFLWQQGRIDSALLRTTDVSSGFQSTLYCWIFLWGLESSPPS